MLSCRFRPDAILMLLIFTRVAQHNCNGEITEYGSGTYVRQPIIALRQQFWPLSSNDGSINAGNFVPVCKHPGFDGRYFFLVAVPSDLLLNDVEIVLSQTLGKIANITAIAVLSSKLTNEISRKLSLNCGCPADALPSDTNSSLPWTHMHQWISTDRSTFKAYVNQIQPISHVVLLFNSRPSIRDVNFGFFSISRQPSKAYENYMAAMPAASMVLLLGLLVITIGQVLKLKNKDCCTQGGKGAGCQQCLNYYWESRRDRATFPPDTGIYMS